ncbi:hypothetical protein F4805DRAFT_53213 [Annulohypoxylon moriforme]|nr:hypothetical protein F4805DRAFT_53213 [Annulohypoxylon moriforme]
MAVHFVGKLCTILVVILFGLAALNFALLLDAMILPSISGGKSWKFTGPNGVSRSATHYQVLGVPNCSPDNDIKAARRRLAQQYHPDKFPEKARDEAAEKMIKINRSYDFLINGADRCTYDYGLGCGFEHMEECMQRREREFQARQVQVREERAQRGREEQAKRGMFEFIPFEYTGTEDNAVFDAKRSFLQWLAKSMNWFLKFMLGPLAGPLA